MAAPVDARPVRGRFRRPVIHHEHVKLFRPLGEYRAHLRKKLGARLPIVPDRQDEKHFPFGWCHVVLGVGARAPLAGYVTAVRVQRQPLKERQK